MRYGKPEAGEWLQPVRKNYKMRCCDCALVHTINFRIKNGRVQLQAFRDERATGQSRRWMKKREQ
jgi:hypothetical protein